MKPTIYKFITEAGDVYAVSARDFAEYSEHIEPTLEDLRALRLQHQARTEEPIAAQASRYLQGMARGRVKCERCGQIGVGPCGCGFQDECKAQS
jgi:hypothetical protein